MRKSTFEAAQVIESGTLLDELVADQQSRIAALPEPPNLAILTTLHDNGAIQTYFNSKRRHADTIGAEFRELRPENEDEAVDRIRRLNDTPETNAVVAQLPLKQEHRTQEVCDAVADFKDVDALSEAGREFFDPPTARAVVELARRFTNNFEGIEPDRVAVVAAMGRLVGSKVVPLLRNEGFSPLLIDYKLNNLDKIRTLGRAADLIITANGRPDTITPSDLKRHRRSELPVTIIDAGVGRTGDGKWYQDLHDDVFKLPHVQATRRTKAVGPLAVAYMFNNVVEAAEHQAATSSA